MFVSVCGIDQSGKSTIIKHLKDRLNPNQFYFTREPRFFQHWKIKNKIVRGRFNSLFFLIDRILHKLKLVKYRHKLIISDRSIICGIAYAYAVSKFQLFVYKLYHKLHFLVPIPKIAFYIIPEFQTKNKEFNTDFRKKVVYGYNQIVPKFYPNLKIIDILNKKGKIKDAIYSIILHLNNLK